MRQASGLPKDIAELSPPVGMIGQIRQSTGKVKRISNLFGLTLLSQQIISFLAAMICAIVYCVIKSAVFHESLTGFSDRFLNDPNSSVSGILTCFVYFSYMFLPLIFQAIYLKQDPLRVVPVKPIRNARLIAPLIALVLTLAALASLLTEYIQLFLGFIHLQATSPDFSLPNNVPAFLIYVIQLCVLAPVCEEFLFRGMILQNLRKFGNAFAVLVSAMLFAMVHGNLLQIPLAFIVGIAFGVIVIEFDSIWVTVIMHACVNGFSVLADVLSHFLGDTVSSVIYFALILACAAVAVVFIILLRRKYGFREKLAQYKKSLLPISFMMKRFFLTPGAFIFSLVTIGLVAYYMRIT